MGGWSPVMCCTWPPSRNHIFQVPPKRRKTTPLAISAQGWLRGKWSWGQEVYWGIKSIQGNFEFLTVTHRKHNLVYPSPCISKDKVRYQHLQHSWSISTIKFFQASKDFFLEWTYSCESPSRWKSCYIRKQGELLGRQRTYPLNNGGWKMTFSFWNGPFSGDILTFNKRLREYCTQKDISPFVCWPLLVNFRGGGAVWGYVILRALMP